MKVTLTNLGTTEIHGYAKSLKETTEFPFSEWSSVPVNIPVGGILPVQASDIGVVMLGDPISFTEFMTKIGSSLQTVMAKLGWPVPNPLPEPIEPVPFTVAVAVEADPEGVRFIPDDNVKDEGTINPATVANFTVERSLELRQLGF